MATGGGVGGTPTAPKSDKQFFLSFPNSGLGTYFLEALLRVTVSESHQNANAKRSFAEVGSQAGAWEPGEPARRGARRVSSARPVAGGLGWFALLFESRLNRDDESRLNEDDPKFNLS